MPLVQSEPKNIKIGTTEIKRVTMRPNGSEVQVRPEGRVLPYDNVYIFDDGIYTGTDTSPKATQIYSDSGIRGAFFDRETKVLWLARNLGIGYYSFDSNTYTQLASGSMSYENNVGASFLYYDDYIVCSACGDGVLYVFDRKNKTYLRNIGFNRASYSGIDISISYNTSYNYISKDHGYYQTYITSLETGNAIRSVFSTAYHQATAFNGKIYISCENGSNNGYIYSYDGSNVRPVTGNNLRYRGICQLMDSGHITKVKPSDYEYDRIILGPARSSTSSYVIKDGATLEKTLSNAAEVGNFVKYDNNTSIVSYDYDTRQSLNFGFTKWDRNTGAIIQRVSFGLSSRQYEAFQVMSITQTGNLGFYRVGIFDINGTKIYSSGNFIGCVSNNIYQG